MAPVRVPSTVQADVGACRALCYSDEQIAKFWSETDKGTRDAITAKIAPSVTRSEQIRDRILAGGRSFLPVWRSRTPSSPHSAYVVSVHSFDDLDVLVRDCISKAESEATAHHSNQRPAARMGRAASEFLLTFRDYCHAYSSVVQLMAGVSQGYSTAALEILSLFIAVAVKKKEIEDDMDTMIQTLKREYERIGLLGDVYPTEQMKVRVADVYLLSVEFLQEATAYYSSTSRHRLWHALSRPPETGLKMKISAIECAVGELVQDRDTLDRIRLARVEDKIDSQTNHTSTSLGSSRVEMIKIALGLRVPRISHSDELINFATLIDGVFGRLRRIPPFDLLVLQSKTPFIAWEDLGGSPRPRSSFLLLHGRTVAPHNTLLSWPSQASLAIVRHLQSRSSTVSWHLCKPDDEYGTKTVSRDPTCAPAITLLSLGYHLLGYTLIGRAALSNLTHESTTRFEALGDRASAAKQTLDAYKTGEKNVNLMDCSRAAMIFLRDSIMAVAHEERAASPDCGKLAVIYLVVDRFDVLPLPDATLLRPLMDLVQNPPDNAVVKVLVVGERKMRDQIGGDGVAEFIEDCEGKTGWGVVEIDQGM